MTEVCLGYRIFLLQFNLFNKPSNDVFFFVVLNCGDQFEISSE